MTQSLHPSAQKGFSLGAELYQQVRPSYPPEIVVWLQDQLKVGENSTVTDLGSGLANSYLSCFRHRQK